ncbi:hypothetical protein [Amphibacillus indicireducens]|uniref:Uncharacterized protein n=1 Tax=Amphibacillus indicireducens TaxID=1076330 RepID=A0ABP7VGN3_9BACI
MKRNFLIILVAAVTSFVSVFLLNQNRQNKVLEELTDLKRSMQLRNNTHFPIQEAGLPYTDNLDNAKMVSEGSQYGVEYYNRLQK